MDANEYHINQHMSKLDTDEKKMQQIEDRAKELMQGGNDYFPWTFQNFEEAIQNAPDYHRINVFSQVAATVKMDFSFPEGNIMALEAIKTLVEEYWIDAAMRKAEAEINQPTW